MDSAHKLHENRSNKYRPPSAKSHQHRDSSDKGIRESQRVPRQALDSKNSNRPSSVVSPERILPKGSAGSSHRISKSMAAGKENLSSNPESRKKKDRRLNYSCVEESTPGLDVSRVEQAYPEKIRRVNTHIDPRQAARKETPQRALSAGKNHRRATSGVVGGHPRSASQDRKRIASKNNSYIDRSQ